VLSKFIICTSVGNTSVNDPRAVKSLGASVPAKASLHFQGKQQLHPDQRTCVITRCHISASRSAKVVTGMTTRRHDLLKPAVVP
jgi:hypothetical protein